MSDTFMGNGQKLTAEDTLLWLMDIITSLLEDIQAAEAEDDKNELIKGAKGAYVTCLELLSRWEKAEENGLDFDIEEVFPV